MNNNYALDLEMALFMYIPETEKRNGMDDLVKTDKRRPSFAEIYETKLERRRLDLVRAAAPRRKVDKKQPVPDLSMQKLYLSLLHRIGGPTPVVSGGDPNASAIPLHALQAWRSGARRRSSQDSDIFSMP